MRGVQRRVVSDETASLVSRICTIQRWPDRGPDDSRAARRRRHHDTWRVFVAHRALGNDLRPRATRRAHWRSLWRAR